MPNPSGRAADRGQIFVPPDSKPGTWKHHVPLLPKVFPYGTIVIITMREVCEWITSLAVNAHTAFDLYPVEQNGKRLYREARKSPYWLIRNKVMLDSQENEFKRVIYPNAFELWMHYARSYALGNISVDNCPQNVILIRHEDIVISPNRMCSELERLGLPLSLIHI